MAELRIQLPDQLAHQIHELVQEGWFASDADVALQALVQFVRRSRLELTEQFQREDIAWALQQRKEPD